MTYQFYSIAIIALLGAMLPGPDFAIVTQNSIFHSRRSGCYTAIGIGAAISIHMTYCVLGLAIIIKSSALLFGIIKYIGATYLIYLGARSFFTKQPKKLILNEINTRKTTLSDFKSFKQGFFVNLLNPKATLFFLSVFTVVIKSETPISIEIIYSLEIIFIAIAWFCTLTVILSHSKMKKILEKSEKYISIILGLFLIIFGIMLVFLKA